MCVSETDEQGLNLKSGMLDNESKDKKLVSISEIPHTSNLHAAVDQEPVRQILIAVISAAQDLDIGASLADILHQDFLKVAEEIGYRKTLESLMIENFIDPSSQPSVQILNSLHKLCSSMSDKERIIVAMRLCEEKPTTLNEVGRELNLTRERVRQIQSKLQKKIKTEVKKNIDCLARLLKLKMPVVMDSDSFDASLSSVFNSNETLTVKLAKAMLKQALGYTEKRNKFLNPQAIEVLEDIQCNANDCADDVGLIDEEKLKSLCLPSVEWDMYWKSLIESSSFGRIDKYWCLRDSNKARVKATLLKIGQCATKEQISTECGITPQNVGGALSNIPSIIRADKFNWGLSEWIDDQYEGIVGEIVQRIREGRGVASASMLIKELPEKFGVSPISVRTYLNTPKFEIQDDEVREAISLDFDLQSFETVIDSRDKEGHALWRFSVESRYFDGYSLLGVPFEIVAAFGCRAGDTIRVEIVKPNNCRPLSVSWPIASLTKATIGFLSDPLSRLECSVDDAVFLVIRNDGLAELRLAQKNQYVNSATSILEKIKRRRQVV